jgi:hypothetical protein
MNQKVSYSTFKKAPTLGEKAMNIGNKIKKLPKNPKFKKVRKRALTLRGNIDYYFQN